MMCLPKSIYVNPTLTYILVYIKHFAFSGPKSFETESWPANVKSVNIVDTSCISAVSRQTEKGGRQQRTRKKSDYPHKS